jgi:hypothetical protein
VGRSGCPSTAALQPPPAQSVLRGSARGAGFVAQSAGGSRTQTGRALPVLPEKPVLWLWDGGMLQPIGLWKQCA